MKHVVLAFVLLVLSIAANAADRTFVASLKCTATQFRQNGGGEAPDLNSLIWVLAVEKRDRLYLEEFGGHVLVSGYYGVFNGKDLIETPYKRATVYRNHNRFMDFDAVFTAGNESGMAGQFIINKDMKNSRGNENFETDAHYVFQAGDHMGGTIDYTCTNTL